MDGAKLNELRQLVEIPSETISQIVIGE